MEAEADEYARAFSRIFTAIPWDGPLGFVIIPSKPSEFVLRASRLTRGMSMRDEKALAHLARVRVQLSEFVTFDKNDKPEVDEYGFDTVDVCLRLLSLS